MARILARIFRGLIVGLAYLAGILALLWAAGALWFDGPGPAALRAVFAGIWLLAGVALWCRGRRRGRLALAVAFLGLLGWWLSLAPRQDRDWRPEVAVLPWSELTGDRLVVHQIRNFQYRTSETDFVPVYDTRSYDLRQLRGIDYFLTHWTGPWIAHPIFSFDFGPGGHLAFSVETRPEKGEPYATIGSLYRTFELIYIAGDERDLVRVRTNYRAHEDVYLYHLQIPPAASREMLLAFLREMNALHAAPRWYHVLLANCAHGLHTLQPPFKPAPWDYRLLLSGKSDEMLYDLGALDRRLPFAELKRRAHLNARAQAANDDPNFSETIRQGWDR